MSGINKGVFLEKILRNHLPQKEEEWLDSSLHKIDKDTTGNKFLLSYSLVQRFITKEAVAYTEKELKELDVIYPSFCGEQWNTHSLSRAVMMSRLKIENNKSILQKLENTASDKEQEDLYKSLYFLENAEDFTCFIEEGIRSNVITVYDAIAHNNPFAATFLSENSWNQLVLKGIFNFRPLYLIYNLQQRNNKQLALVANDYVNERWAAGRTFTPELWQLMIGANNDEMKTSLTKAKNSSDFLEKNAATKVLNINSGSEIYEIEFWNTIGKEYINTTLYN